MTNLFLSINSLLLTTAVPDSTTVSYQINQFFNTMVNHLGQVGESLEGNFATYAAQSVAAICVLFYLAWEMWPVIMGNRGPDITKLLRPVLIAGVISAWPFFFLFFENIKTNLAAGAREMYTTQQNDIMAAEKTMAMRIEKMDSIRKKDLVAFLAASGNYDGMDMTSLESKEFSELQDDYIDNEIKAGRQNRFAAGMIEFANWLSTIIENLLKWIGQIALQAFFCGLLVVGDFGTIVMGMFGPIMFALSIAGAYRNHWAKWIEKYLCIALYPCLGYIAMAYVNWMILYYLEVECNITETAVADWEAFVSVSYNHFGLIINYLVALFTGSYVMRAVPDIARAVFPGPSGNAAASAGAFVSGMTMATAGATVKVTTTAIKATVGTAGAAVGAAMSKSKSEKNDPMKDTNHSKKSNKEKDDGFEKDAGPSRKEEARSSIKDLINPFRWFSTPLVFGAAKNLYNEADKAERKNRKKSEVKNSQYSKKKNRYSRNYKNDSDGQSFGYKRTGSSRHKGSTYNPSANDKYTRRGENIRLPKFRHNVTPAKLRAYWGSSIGFLTNFVLADDSNADPQAWATALGGIKAGARNTSSLPWIFANHYKKHSANGTYQAINHWQKERHSDMVFVRRPAVGGYTYQTYGEEAHMLAKLTGEKVRYVRVGTQKVATFTLNKHNLQPVIHRLNELGLSVNVINAKGKSIYYKDDITFGKKDAIDRIKAVIKEKGGDLHFNQEQKEYHTELSGDRYGNNRTVNIQDVITDIYGALHVVVVDQNGDKHSLYIDRLKEDELLRMATAIEEEKDNQNAISVIIPDEKQDDFDKVVDELNFTANEENEYAQMASHNAQKSRQSNGTSVDISQQLNQPADQAVQNTQAESSQDDTPVQQQNKAAEQQTRKAQKHIDPIQQLKKDTAWVNTSAWSEIKDGLKGGAKSTLLFAITGSALLLNKFRPGRWLISKSKAAKDSVSTAFGWNDKTQADIQKDLRAGIEYKWHFRTTVKDGIDYRMRPRRLPLSFSLRREKVKVINRGRGISFAGVDYKNRTGIRKTAHYGWKMTRWTTKGVFNTARYALGVATGTRPLTNISAIGTTGFKATYNGVRWMTRKTTARNAVIAWKRENKHNYVIVRRNGVRGSFYQTYGEDAIAIARILHKESSIKAMHIGKGQDFGSGRFFNRNTVPSLVLTKDDLARLNSLIEKRGLTMDVINTKGRSLLTKQNELTAALGIEIGRKSTSQNKDKNVQNAQPSQAEGLSKPTNTVIIGDETTIPKDEAQDDGPVILKYSRKDNPMADKTFELKDKSGNILYVVTGESLGTILEHMVKDGYSLKGLDLSNTDLRDTILKNADLSDSILTGANLRGAKLQKAILTNADLTNANLRVSNLYKADLTNSTLAFADMRDANIKKATLTGANLSSADLRGTGLEEQDRA